MPRQTCIFCECDKPLMTITKEHLFFRWVDQVLTPELLGPDRYFERTTTGRDGEDLADGGHRRHRSARRM